MSYSDHFYDNQFDPFNVDHEGFEGVNYYNNGGGVDYDGLVGPISSSNNGGYSSSDNCCDHAWVTAALANLDTSHQTVAQQDLPVLDIGAAERNEKKIGLKLGTHSKIKQRGSTSSQADDEFVSPEKLKAANFPANSLQIGSWKRVSRQDSELVAKCYFKKQKLVWEVLDGYLKNKLEFPWTNIVAIRATIPANGRGYLDIMLEKKPLFFREVNPQPRKHTTWELSGDFTNDHQASLIRLHTLEFAKGVLEKPYERLLQADKRLHTLSQQPFPDQASPYFPDINFANNHYFDIPNLPSHFLSNISISGTTLPMPGNGQVMNFPGHIISNYYPNQFGAGVEYAYQANDPLSTQNVAFHPHQILGQEEPAGLGFNHQHGMLEQLQIATPSPETSDASNQFIGRPFQSENDPLVHAQQQPMMSYMSPQDYVQELMPPHESTSISYDELDQSNHDYQYQDYYGHDYHQYGQY